MGIPRPNHTGPLYGYRILNITRILNTTTPNEGLPTSFERWAISGLLNLRITSKKTLCHNGFVGVTDCLKILRELDLPVVKLFRLGTPQPLNRNFSAPQRAAVTLCFVAPGCKFKRRSCRTPLPNRSRDNPIAPKPRNAKKCTKYPEPYSQPKIGP